MLLVRHRIDGLEKHARKIVAVMSVRHRIDGLEMCQLQNPNNQNVRHRIDGLETAAVKAHHGYGTWVRYAEGRAPVGFSDNASDIAEYKTMGNTFGENTHQLKIEEMPSHYHTNTDHMAEGRNYDNNSMYYGNPGAGNIEGTFKTGSTGGNQPHNNIQPSIVTGYWLRTA